MKAFGLHTAEHGADQGALDLLEELHGPVVRRAGGAAGGTHEDGGVATAPGSGRHGAAPDAPMTHVTVQSSASGGIDWHVDERDWAEGYRA